MLKLKIFGSLVLAAMIGSGATFAGAAWIEAAHEAALNQERLAATDGRVLLPSVQPETPFATLLRHYDMDREANANRADAILQQLRALNDTEAKLLVSQQEGRTEAIRAHADTMCIFRLTSGCPGFKGTASAGLRP